MELSRVEYLEAIAKEDLHAAHDKLTHIFGSASGEDKR
jgi:hypothetical protein